MHAVPDDAIDHYALGYYAPRKGLAREACPYAADTEAGAQWLAGYDAALAGKPEPSPPGRDEGAPGR
ncbi:ribosome modulation factor [Methylobacterium sp. ID0610]|uniref:ribosome modulation factor n=1 Tax=Methylobacterium carpenticola TaxID=3344827 RepID=UPI0036B31E05